MSRHQRQESEANRFAIELLAPRQRIRPHLNQDPNLAAVLELSKDLNISKEAIARRLFELSESQIALIFHQGLTVRYVLKQDDFPRLLIWNAATMPPTNDGCDNRGLTKTDWVELEDWLSGAPKGELTAQTLFQQNGFGMTLLVFDGEADHGETGVEDAYDRYNRWNR